MGKRLMLVAGVAVGYVLGSRAGRKRYDQIAAAAGKLWKSDRVQKQVHNVEDFAKDKAPEVVDFVSGNVKKATGKGKSPSSVTGSTSADGYSTTPTDPAI